MRVYLSSPGNQMHAAALESMPVLISYALKTKWMESYIPSFGPVLMDSGAFSEMNTGKAVSLDGYGQYLEETRHRVDAAAALDDIRGNWKRSLSNWDALPHTFPVLHDSDPPEYIDAVFERLQDQHRARLRPSDPQWVGIGLVPPRKATDWALKTLKRIPGGCHVHLFALRKIQREALAVRRDISFDSTNWMLDSWQYRNSMPWLTPAECVEIVVKRYRREKIDPAAKQSRQADLWEG